MSAYLIEDGYTARKKIPAQVGVPEAMVEYRPALHAEKLSYLRTSSISAEANAKADFELLRQHVQLFNGGQLPEPLERLKPNLLAYLRDLILGYEAEDEASDAKNSVSG